ncbi:hypothetical protein NQ318_005314 [Aromia moschata]|uniref:Uncharacterized protein n=1 Tax=Aromia moschata TaxID=1265417 RepID=A0AAV8XTX9_9CUCU|nr:hypothetical protein NQ318_005314 [Aromia moschata]
METESESINTSEDKDQSVFNKVSTNEEPYTLSDIKHGDNDDGANRELNTFVEKPSANSLTAENGSSCDTLEKPPTDKLHVNRTSDEENEILQKDDVGNTILTNDDEDDVRKGNKSKKKHFVVDSDSDEETPPVEIQNDGEPVENTQIKKKKHKCLAIVDSDSEIENDYEITQHNKSFSDDSKNRHEEGQVVPQKSDASFTSVQSNKSSGSAACGPDSSEEAMKNDDEDDVNEKVNAKSYKSKPKQKKGIFLPMTAKEAARQRLKIQSETQRMIRERNVYVHYHRPRPITREEFFTKRTQLSSVVPESQRGLPLR